MKEYAKCRKWHLLQIPTDVGHVKMSISAVWGAGVKEDSEKFSEKKEFLSVGRLGPSVTGAAALVY